MVGKSKFIGKVYDGWVVTGYYKENSHRDVYGVNHNAMSYLIEHPVYGRAIISGNSLRLVNKGEKAMATVSGSKRVVKIRG